MFYGQLHRITMYKSQDALQQGVGGLNGRGGRGREWKNLTFDNLAPPLYGPSLCPSTKTLRFEFEDPEVYSARHIDVLEPFSSYLAVLSCLDVLSCGLRKRFAR